MKTLWALAFATSLTAALFVNPWFFVLVFLSLFFDLIDGFEDAIKNGCTERDHIWRMNNGPSSMNRIRMFKSKGDDKITMMVWKGDQYGYYEDGKDGKKYDRDMREIENVGTN